MNCLKKLLLCLFCSALPVLLFSQTAAKIDGLGLNNLYRIDKDIYRSEQPDANNFKALENYGIKEILNLRAWHSDRKKLANGMLEHRITMNAHNITNYDVVNALKIIKNRKYPILIHCHHGSDRTGVIVAMYRIVFQGWSKDDAIDEMATGNFGFHGIYGNIIKYVKNVDTDYIKQELEKSP